MNQITISCHENVAEICSDIIMNKHQFSSSNSSSSNLTRHQTSLLRRRHQHQPTTGVLTVENFTRTTESTRERERESVCVTFITHSFIQLVTFCNFNFFQECDFYYINVTNFAKIIFYFMALFALYFSTVVKVRENESGFI